MQVHFYWKTILYNFKFNIFWNESPNLFKDKYSNKNSLGLSILFLLFNNIIILLFIVFCFYEFFLSDSIEKERLKKLLYIK